MKRAPLRPSPTLTSVATILLFPFGIQQIPVGFEFSLVDQRRVIAGKAHVHAGRGDEKIFAFRIGIMMFFQPPLRGVFYFGENETRIDRLQKLAAIKSVR
jgi:hypothetical protein